MLLQQLSQSIARHNVNNPGRVYLTLINEDTKTIYLCYSACCGEKVQLENYNKIEQEIKKFCNFNIIWETS